MKRPILCLSNITGKKLTDSDIHLIIDRLKQDRGINHLDLSGNWIGNNGIKELLMSPHINKIFYLNLWNNHIGDEGAVAVVKSSHYNNIASLDLGMNRITPKGIKALARHIPGSKLVSLGLILNPGADDPSAFQEMLKAVKSHPPLQYMQYAFRSQMFPVLLENRRIVALTKQSLSSLIAELKEYGKFYYPMDMLDSFVLTTFQEYYGNQMLNSFLTEESDSLVMCNQLNNYINDNYFKITGVVQGCIKLEERGRRDVMIADLPPEVLAHITGYCYISDVKDPHTDCIED